MKHPFSVAIAMATAILLGGGGTSDAKALEIGVEHSDELEPAPPLPLEVWSGDDEIDYQLGRPRQPGELDETMISEEVAYEVWTAVWAHLGELLRTGGGVIRVAKLPGRELVPIWTHSVTSPAPGRFEVAVEMTAVTLVPADFPTIGEASLPPTLVPRTPEQANRLLATRRSPASFQITFELRRFGRDRYEVVAYRVTGRPGPRR